MSDFEPKVSVIIPAYNRADSLSAAIESVLCQTYRNLEVVIVDDGSTDNTAEVVAGIKDPRVRYLRSNTRGGASAARNFGMERQREDYIAFQDSDDVWFPEKLEKQMRLFAQDPEVDVVYCALWRTEFGVRECIPLKDGRHMGGDVFDEMLKGNLVSTATAVVKRKCFDAMGMFDTSLTSLEDWDLFIRMAASFNFGFINEPLVESMVRQDSITADRVNWYNGYAAVIEKNLGAFRKRRRLLAKHLGSIGHGFCLAGDMARGRRFLARSAVTNPLRLKCIVALLTSLLGWRFYSAVMRLRSACPGA